MPAPPAPTHTITFYLIDGTTVTKSGISASDAGYLTGYLGSPGPYSFYTVSPTECVNLNLVKRLVVS
jgi:hypothetical protein